MKKLVYLLMILAIGSHCKSWAVTSIPQWKEQVIDSAILGEKRDIIIYMPAGYQNNQDYYPEKNCRHLQKFNY